MKNNDDERMKRLMAENSYVENDNSFYLIIFLIVVIELLSVDNSKITL